LQRDVRALRAARFPPAPSPRGPQCAGRRIVGRSQPHPLLLVEHGGQLELRVKPVESGLEGSAHSQHADDFAGDFFFDGDRVLV